MRLILAALTALLLGACGVETASTAATAGALKKQEIEQGKKTMEQVGGRVEQSLGQDRQRLQQAADRAGQ